MRRTGHIERWGLMLMAWVLPLCALFSHTRVDDAERKAADQRRLTYFYMAAEQQRQMGNHSAMMELLQHCLEIDANHPAVNFELAMVYFSLRNDSTGLRMLKTAVEHDPNNPWYLETLASVYMSMRKPDMATPILEHMSKLQTKRTDILGQLLQLYKNDGRTQDAISTLDRIQTLQGNNARIATQKYALYLDLGDTLKAFEQMKELCREYPYDANSLLMLSDVYMTAGQTDSAKAIFDKVERIDPLNIDLQAAKMQYLLAVGDTMRYREMRDSIVLDEKADTQLRINGMSLIAREGLADSTYRMHTEQMFAALLAPEKPEMPMLQLYLAYRAYAYGEGTEQLLPIMERMLEVEPSDMQTLQELLRYYISTNNIERVGDICKKALIYHPSELTFHYFLALSLAQEKKMQETVDALETAIRQADESSRPEILGDVYALLGDVQHELGNEKASFMAYDSCLTYTPENISCLNNYAYYLSLKNEQLDKAEKMSYRTIKAEPNNKTYLDTYAWILFMQEDYTTARIYMDKVVDTKLADSILLEGEETSAVVLEHAGDIHAQCGNIELAVRLWKLAQEKDTNTKNTLLNKKIRKQKYIKK